METQEIKNRLEAGELMEFINDDDQLFIWKSKTGLFVAEFNAKVVFGFKTFKAFVKELTKWIERKALTED